MMTEKRRKKCAKGVKSAAAVLMCATLALPVAGAAAFHANAAPFGTGGDGKFYTDYTSIDEARAEAEKIALDMAAEGQTLLKNVKYSDGRTALPMSGGEYVSVFGVGSDRPAGFQDKAGDKLLVDALVEEGFKVNPQLKKFYENDNTSVSGRGGWNPGSSVFAERKDFDKGIENSFGVYNDAAIIVLSRGGGEGNDMETMTKEVMKDESENIGGWEHLAPGSQGEGKDKKEYKHFLQMTDSEVELLKYVKAQGFKKIVYLINSSEIFELKNLEDDAAVDSILWIGRPGQVGMTATAKILKGEINPSGRTVDTWYSDFTADPTWYNVTNNAQVGSSNQYLKADGTNAGYYGIDYDEDIYVGYRYYETKAADMNAATPGSGDTWYDSAVVYPFGYGLSYSTFDYSNMKVTLDNKSELSGTLDASLIASGAGKTDGGQATVKTMTVSVDVRNSGNVAGKETVEIYVNAPYVNGQVEKSHVKLVGFGKTDLLRPGEKQTVDITVNVQDLASYDYTDANKNGFKGYEIDEGAYSLMALHNAHGWAETGVTKVDFTVENGTNAQDATASDMTKAAYLELDDYSGEKIENLFSKENSVFYSLRKSDGAYKFNAKESEDQVLMSRANTAESNEPSNAFTLPQTISEASRKMTDNMFKSLQYWDNFQVDKKVAKDIAGNETTYYTDGQSIAGIVDGTKDFPWMAETSAHEEEMKTWTQTGAYGIKLAEMAGLDPYDTETVITSGRFKDKTHAAAWEEFMNTLSWKDLMDIVGQYQKMPFDKIEMNQLIDFDNATYPGDSESCSFSCNCILAATFNPDIAEAKGIVTANMALLKGKNNWWGGSANTHRSPFAGRVFEYPSEDGILAGVISGAETLGANSRGLTTYVKHCALNDQETNRNTRNLFAWVSEQAMREIYYKSFQMLTQEGKSTAIMGAFARAGRVSINVNYNFVQALFRDEWGAKTISFTTDMYGAMKSVSPLDMLVRAGTDNIATNTMSGTWDAALKLNESDTTAKGGVKVASDAEKATAMSVTGKNQWYTTRKCAMIFLWTHANTAMNKNGVDFSGWTVPELKATQGAEIAKDVTVKGAGIEGGKIEYVVTGGKLPDGITLASDGTLSGKPTAKAGTYEFTVTCKVDNWVTASKNMSYTVTSAFEIDETEGKLGEDFYAAITSESITDKVYNQGVKYSVKSGVLPKGLSLNEDGEIEGTPMEAGEFAVVVTATGTNKTSGYNGKTTVESFDLDVTIDIAAGASSANDIEFRVEGGRLEYKTEGGDWTAISSGTSSVGGVSIEVGEKVNGVTTITITNADGTKQTVEVKDGVDGAKGDPGEGGCGSKVETTSAAVAAAVVLAGLGALLIARKKKQNA